MRSQAGTTPLAAGSAAAGSATVVTRVKLAASPAEVWDGLMYYEQIARRPPLHLRLLLPVPLRTEGRKAEVGDESLCLYEGGSLRKRITRSEPRHHLGFEVYEQKLPLGGGMKLSGGSYTLRELTGGLTEVGLETRYLSSLRPRWLWRPLELAVCHLFHRYLLGAMRRDIESRRAR